VFRTADGKPWPWSPGASDQLTSIDIFYGGPGSGKSALQNTINLALVTDPRNEFLPRITNIDIGPSATGFIDEMRAALGPEREHLALYARLQNTPEYAINILEPALLGCSRLLPTERDAAANFVTLLVTPVGEKAPHSEIGALVVRAIDATFDYFVRLEPRNYTRGREPLVDTAIFKHQLNIDDQTTWWEVRDDLFAVGATREALRAQTYAVPLVPDLISAVRNDPSISSVYGRVPAHQAGGESLLDYFCRRLTDACAMFPILTEPTRFETGEARLIVLDLDAVAKGTGATAERQIGIMYNLAMKAGVSHLYINKDDVAYVDEPYRAYQAKRINALRNEANMRVCFGEFHRMGSQDACIAQVMLYAREGRKWGVQLAMDSQLLSDYPDDLIKLATNVFIMEGGDAETIRSVGHRFGLNSTAMEAMKRLRGPTERGAPFLLYMKTKAATYSLLLYSSPGPRELWLHSTTPTDAAIRNWLYDDAVKRGKDRRWARNVLAIAYPKGSAKKEYEALAMRRHDLASDEDGTSIELIEIMAKNAIDRVDSLR
jgi:intracellular multiplication protein IcmB